MYNCTLHRLASKALFPDGAAQLVEVAAGIDALLTTAASKACRYWSDCASICSLRMIVVPLAAVRFTVCVGSVTMILIASING